MSREQKLFRFLDDCAPAARIVLGDGRLTVAAEPPGALDLLVVDAFSSDAIPIHLITREALAVYRAKLAEGGAILFHISNRYIDLEPVLAALARDAGLAARILVTRAPANEPVPRFRYASTWVVMARDEAALAAATEGFDRARPTAWGAWRRPVEKPGARLWTDDYSNVVSVLKRKQP
jgi:spermidine synthase